MKKILITGQVPKEGINSLYEYFEVNYPEKTQMNYNDVSSVIGDYEIILAASVRADKSLLEKALKLQYIGNFGVGYDSIDVEYATEKNIIVSNTPTSVTESTAELAFGLMHAVARRIAECDRKLRTNPDLRWGLMQNLGQRLHGKSLGILGMGRIGKALARRATAANMKIFYHNRNRLNPKEEKLYNASYLTFEELFKISDFISVNIPMSKESFHIIGEKELNLTKPTAYIINTARGAVIDEMVLISFLKKGRIAGAGLDVFENEPKISKDFFELDNVVITPHIGTASIESRIEIGAEAAQNIIDYYIHKKPTNVVNPEVLGKIKK
jgi:lactate dehydrogenase-like 2-hydroxyacid dehydrogenase